MTELSSRSVDNGKRLYVQTAFFKGVAGVRANQRGGEFAFAGEMPSPRDRTGTIGERAIRITEIRQSATAAGLIVAQFIFAEGK